MHILDGTTSGSEALKQKHLTTSRSYGATWFTGTGDHLTNDYKAPP